MAPSKVGPVKMTSSNKAQQEQKAPTSPSEWHHRTAQYNRMVDLRAAERDRAYRKAQYNRMVDLRAAERNRAYRKAQLDQAARHRAVDASLEARRQQLDEQRKQLAISRAQLSRPDPLLDPLFPLVIIGGMGILVACLLIATVGHL